MSDKKPKHSHSAALVSLIATAIILAVAAALYFNRQWIIDEINFLSYKPSAEIASFAEKSSMNDQGKFLFYSAKPSLQNSSEFNISCPSYSTSMAILGCYDGQKIYIYNITDPQLNGIRDETAAYEMLHAAYVRLSKPDRAKLDALIEKEYAKQATSDTEASVQYFAKYEPGDRDNELFSVIATQFKTIDPELEKYYSRYFYDRQQLVTLYDTYSSVFTKLENQANDLYKQVNTMNDQVKSDTEDYNQKNAQLNADVTTFNQKAQSGQLTQSTYVNQKAALEARITALQAEQVAINKEIQTLNDLVTQYNALNVQFQKLNQSINSSVAPTPSL